ncbi:hypothetical protein [Maritimibacter fusiformis]|uniref:Uncharacterized protein n=1 Tax=Maritimibacter fusiformis TaxID=2603819 RepID=A0A5D0R8S6_9RHOB|nr:hypothetical protein [Maritimibacter fusiformis]TYB77887.1 hypothetical protein FVF75_16750 [Maritimibacter fusiformis]
MIRLVALVFALLTPVPGVAQQVLVLGGEHEDFTRLVIDTDVAADWVFGRVDGGFEFRPGRSDITYDLRRAFDRIPRTRIAEMEDRGGGRLFLSVDCACHGDAFDLRGGRVVLDIKDGTASASAAQFQATLPAAALPTLAETTAPAVAVAVGDRAGLPLIAPESPRDAGPELRFLPPGGVVAAEAGPIRPIEISLPDPPVTMAAPDPRVTETETALLEQIARAAAQGLVEADMSTMQDEIAAATHPLGEPPTARPELPPAPVPPPPVSARDHVAVTTSLDRAAGGRAETEDGGACIDPALLALETWGAPVENGTEIGAYRARLLGEFDIANGEGVTELARYYVFIGFGAEALAVIRRHPDDVVRADLLAAMAQIMDHGHADADGPLAGQAECDGATALWAVLAAKRLDVGQPINRRAVLLSFGALSAQHRRHLGPILAQKFLDIGDTETAAAIRSASERGAPTPTPALGLVSARLARATGDAEAADTHLDALIEDGSGVLPEALLERVETTLSRGEVVPEATIDLIESLEFERRGSAAGRQLRAARLEALASASRFDEAFALLAQSSGGNDLPAGRHEDLTDRLTRKLASDASDATFLRQVVALNAKTTPLEAETRRAVAARLIDLGFTDRARGLLDGGSALPEPEDRLLYARVALREGKPKVAVGYLAGLDGAAAQRLRAEAMAAASDHLGAASEYEELGDAAAETETAWLGGLWDRLADLEGEPRAAAARLMLQDGPDQGLQNGPPLARSRGLVAASAEVRATLQRILDEVPGPRD